MMRHADAIDLLLGAMGDIARDHAPDAHKKDMMAGIAKCVFALHEAVRLPVSRVFPELDIDNQ